MKAAAAVYNKAHPDVTINVVDIPENIEGKIEAGLQANGAGLPDITLYQDFRIEQLIQNYPTALVDLKAAGLDYSKFAQYKLGPMSAGGKIFGVPFDTGSTGFFLRTDILKAAGVDPDRYMKSPKWSDIVKLGETVKAKTGKALIAYDTTSFDFLRIMVQSAGAQFFKPDGSLNLRTPAMEKSLAILKDLNDKGILYQAEGWNNWVSALNNGDTAGFMNALWMIGTLKSKPENAGKWMVIPTPLLEGVPGAQNASNNGGSSWYVFSSSPNKALAIDFLKSTWASPAPDALEFYNTILKNSGAMGTYLPSQKGSNYTAKDEFFYKSQAGVQGFRRLDGEGPRPDVYAELPYNADGRVQRHPRPFPGQSKERGRSHRGRRGGVQADLRSINYRSPRGGPALASGGLPASGEQLGGASREQARILLPIFEPFRLVLRCARDGIVRLSFIAYPILSSLYYVTRKWKGIDRCLHRTRQFRTPNGPGQDIFISAGARAQLRLHVHSDSDDDLLRPRSRGNPQPGHQGLRGTFRVDFLPALRDFPRRLFGPVPHPSPDRTACSTTS